MAKKQVIFGGMKLNFKGQDKTLEEVFGKKNIAPTEMTKILWTFIKRRRNIKVTPK